MRITSKKKFSVKTVPPAIKLLYFGKKNQRVLNNKRVKFSRVLNIPFQRNNVYIATIIVKLLYVYNLK